MAITRDTFTAVTSPGNVSSASFSHTCSGANRLLLVALTKRTSNDITGVTYNSVAMTQLIHLAHSAGTEHLYIYGLLNPASGSNTVSITASAPSVMYHGATSYDGVNQSQTLTSNTGSTTTNTLTINVAVANSAMFMLAQSSIDNIGASTNSTLINQFNGVGMLESNALVIPSTGNFSMSYTGTTANAVGVAFAPAPPNNSGFFRAAMN